MPPHHSCYCAGCTQARRKSRISRTIEPRTGTGTPVHRPHALFAAGGLSVGLNLCRPRDNGSRHLSLLSRLSRLSCEGAYSVIAGRDGLRMQGRGVWLAWLRGLVAWTFVCRGNWCGHLSRLSGRPDICLACLRVLPFAPSCPGCPPWLRVRWSRPKKVNKGRA